MYATTQIIEIIYSHIKKNLKKSGMFKPRRLPRRVKESKIFKLAEYRKEDFRVGK